MGLTGREVWRLAPTAYRRERLEKFAALLQGRKDFYSGKSKEYLADPDRPRAGNMKLWRENAIRSDVYDEILAELTREFELGEVKTQD